ncbi:MAG TPA: TIGR01777 family oxidoreductase [Gaiella sp.]|nr:TIGR01777 family oxidoreductase [Gaiella sp.]
MKVAVTGASGLVGSALVPALRAAGHNVVRLVRRAASAEDEIEWHPDTGAIDAAALAGVDGVVHLAGETIGQRWSADARRRILGSRVDGTGLVARTMASLEPRPSVLVHASGVGYYGLGDEPVTEASPRGEGFAADVVEAWERAAEPAREAGIRVVSLRTAPILDRSDGPVGRMRLPFLLGLGGRVGDGRQWWSWVSLRDTVSAYLYALESDLSGPANVVAGAVPNAEFTKALGKALHRPTLFPLPATAVRLAFGQMGEELLLGGQRPLAERLTEAGYEFRDTRLDAALADALST